MWIPRLLLGVKYLTVPCLALCAMSLHAQSGTYASSAEYQGMLEELHAPAPSPIFLATGTRPLPEQDLKVKVHDTRGRLELKTQSLQITIDRPAATLTMLNLANPRQRGSSPLQGKPRPHPCRSPLPPSLLPSPISPGNKTPGPSLTNLQPETRPSPSDCCMQAWQHCRLRAASSPAPAPAAGPAPLTIHIAGADPCFGLGERFHQAALSHTHFDVRPADRSGEPGHNWSYVAIPLVYTPTGLGLYADTVFDTNFNFNDAGSAFDLRVANTPVTFYLLSAPNPKAILEQYTALTGRPENPPLWTFGPWITALQGRDAVLEEAQRIRTEGIPASALWVFDELDEPNNLGWPFWFSSYYGDPARLQRHAPRPGLQGPRLRASLSTRAHAPLSHAEPHLAKRGSRETAGHRHRRPSPRSHV